MPFRSRFLPFLLAVLVLGMASCDESHVDPPTAPAPHPGDTSAPTITKVSPVNGARNVQLGSTIQVVFSESVQPATVNSGTFVVSGSGQVAGTITLTDSIALFSPAAPFSPNTTYTARVTAGVKDLAGNALASEYIWSFTTGPPPDTTPPTVVVVDPADGSTNVPQVMTIVATFSERVDPATISTATFVLTGSAPVPGEVTLSGASATFTPSSPLEYGTTYTARVTTGVRDEAGNPLAADYVWSFTTVPPPDVTSPTVVSVAPLDGESGVAISATVQATFSEAVDPGTLTTATFTLADGGPVSGTVTLTDFTATFTPSSPLAYNTTYTARITTGVRDVAGNALGADSVWTFTTGTAPDLTPPTVSSVTPLSGATGVAIGTTVTAIFSEAVAPASVSTTTFLLNGGAPVAGTVTLNGTTATFTPSSPLAYSTTYTAQVTTGVQDLAGNHLALDYVWSFTTSPPPDQTPPTVTDVTPLDGATDVTVSATVGATFSETMSSGSLSTASFLLTGDSPVAGTVTLNGATATFTPSAPLAGSTTYTAQITTAVQDLAGNNLAADYIWSFTTGTAPDLTPPTVSDVAPPDGATGVSIGAAVTATFSEAVAPASVSSATFLLDGTSSVTGTVDLVGTTATLTPSTTLEYGTTYTARITTGVQDLAGNNLASDFVWTFTTEAAPDVTPPTVTGVTPTDGATGVAVGTTVTATFSEPVAPGTVTDATFLLAGGAPVAGTVTVAGSTATFTPSAPLSGNTTYTATVTTGVQDLAGNNLGADFVWTFSTANQPPVANAGPDQTVFWGALVALDGTASSDPDGDPLTYTWSQVRGPDVTGGSGTLNGPQPTFTAPSQNTRVDFSLVVNDGSLSSSPNRVRINVTQPIAAR